MRLRHLHWTIGLMLGVAGVLAVTTLFWLLPGDVPQELPALLLLVPIVGTSAVWGWRAGVPVALIGAVAHAAALARPEGGLRFGYTPDTIVPITFAGVAVIASLVVSRRSIVSHAQLIGEERMLLLRSVSHDLRNPLHSIGLAATTLLDDDRHDPDTRRHLLELVVDESARLDRIVANLLSLSRLQAGAFVPDRRPTSLAEIVDGVRDRYARLGSPVVIDGSHVDDVELDVDPVQLDQLLANLVDNAVHHVPGDVVVVISTPHDPPPRAGRCIVAVHDDGPGFPEALRVGGPAAFRSGGGSSGLGLTVCQAIAEAHGGRFQLADHPAGGALVLVELPLAPTSPSGDDDDDQ